jgi:chemotaxis response regulator CheB
LDNFDGAHGGGTIDVSSEGRFQQTIMNAAIRVFSVDDHALFREGIAMIINCQPGMLMVAQASNGREAIELFREHKPDVTLMDLRLPDMSSIDAMIAIRTDFPGARIIILTTFESDTERQRALAQRERVHAQERASEGFGGNDPSGSQPVIAMVIRS